jgi:hypothetical protein
MPAPKTRLDALTEIAAKDPKNPFPRYGIAMELANTGREEEAFQAFRALVTDAPGYVATYLMAGKLCEKMGRFDDARDFYRRGIDAAGRAGNQHAREELEGALGMLH